MSSSRIVLYYVFTPLKDPEAVKLWQHTLCRELGLKGRILISEHGINGTVGGDLKAVKQYVRQTRSYGPFKGIEFKWSEGGAEQFPRLSVKVKPELVAFGVPEEVEVDSEKTLEEVGETSPLSKAEILRTLPDDAEAVKDLIRERIAAVDVR